MRAKMSLLGGMLCPESTARDQTVSNDIKKIKIGKIWKEKDIENLAVESMSRHTNGQPIHENATGMQVEIIRNIFRYHQLTKAMKRYGKN
jgi:hypothetical protein